jgi:hypothetical protein
VQFPYDVKLAVSDALSSFDIQTVVGTALRWWDFRADRAAFGRYASNAKRLSLPDDWGIDYRGGELLDYLAAWMLNREHPVGSLFFTTENANPGTRIGGTWVAWGAGRVPVGVDGAQSEFDAVEETGGEKAHKLTIAEMPSHRQPLTQIYENASPTAYGSGRVGGTLAEAGANYTGYEGGDGYHNNLQPYITCYMWKRTA